MGSIVGIWARVASSPRPDNTETWRFGESNTIVIDGEYEVFCDASVRLIPAPGHTAGHQVLYVDLVQTGSVVLSGGLHVLRVGRDGQRVPPFNADSAKTAEAIYRIEAFIDASESELWIGHELARFNQLLKPPEYNW